MNGVNIQQVNVNIQQGNVTKFLGIYVDSNLNWDIQINGVCKNIAKNISILNKVKLVLDSSAPHTLYCTLILPYLNYTSEIWGNTYDSKLSKVIQMQKRAVRIVDKAHYREHTNPIFLKYKLLKFEDIVNLKTILVVYQAKNNLLPTNIQNRFQQLNEVHSYNTRSNAKGNYNVTFCRTKQRSMSVSVKGVRLWNSLNDQLRNVSPMSYFRSSLKRHFINNYIKK